MRWGAMIGLALAFGVLMLLFTGEGFGLIDTNTSDSGLSAMWLLGAAIELVAMAYYLNWLIRAPIRITDDHLFIPGYWFQSKRVVRWADVADLRIQKLFSGQSRLRMVINDGSSRFVPLGFVKDRKGFVSEVRSHVAPGVGFEPLEASKFPGLGDPATRPRT